MQESFCEIIIKGVQVFLPCCSRAK